MIFILTRTVVPLTGSEGVQPGLHGDEQGRGRAGLHEENRTLQLHVRNAGPPDRQGAVLHTDI